MVESADLAYALDGLKARQAKYATYRNYVEGRHNLAFSSDTFRSAFGSLFKQLAYNRCSSVVDALVDRLVIEGWQTGDGKEATNAAEIWARNNMARRQGEIWQEAATAGDAYLIVWPDEETNLARIEPNAAHCTTVLYDEEYPARRTLGVKAWKVERGEYKGRWRVTVYEPDLVTRWITTNRPDGVPTKPGALVPYEDDNQPEADNPWGVVPVFHFANNANTGDYGTSELRDVIPLQDALNKSLADMMVAEEYAGFPQRWVVGIEPVLADDGSEFWPFKPGVDRLWTVAQELAKFGQFDPVDIEKFLTLQDGWDAKISRVSRTPIHWMTGDIGNSGEQLKTAEGPFVSKTHDRQHACGPEMTGAMQLAERMDGVEEPGLTPIWQPAESRSVREQWETVQLMVQAGVPLPIALEDVMGWDETKVARVAALMAHEQQTATEAIRRFTDSGAFDVARDEALA